jgi:N-acetylmuramoyl-L-alanine amidase
MKKLITIISILLVFLMLADTASAYTVKEGDTLTSIATQHNLTINELIVSNPQIKNEDLIYIGETLNIVAKNETSPQEKEEFPDKNLLLLAEVVRKEAQTETELEKINEAIDGLAAAPVEVQVQDEVVKEDEKPSELSKYSEKEIDLLARLVRAEAQTEPFEGKVAVACVVLNRIESPLFPDTMKEVIYERKQFQPVSNGQINKPADQESIDAVIAALTTQRDMAPGSLFFYNPDIATSRWLDSRATTLVIGQHVFKK